LLIGRKNLGPAQAAVEGGHFEGGGGEFGAAIDPAEGSGPRAWARVLTTMTPLITGTRRARATCCKAWETLFAHHLVVVGVAADQHPQRQRAIETTAAQQCIDAKGHLMRTGHPFDPDAGGFDAGGDQGGLGTFDKGVNQGRIEPGGDHGEGETGRVERAKFGSVEAHGRETRE
jgi:hypothetical protein